MSDSIKTYALLVGCEYHDTKDYLPGCIYDVEMFKNYILKSVPLENISVMTDVEEIKPTKINIKNALIELISKSHEEKCNLIFHFSGHGSSIPDMNFEESDGYDECLIPTNKIQSIDDVLLDDELHEIISKLCPKSKLFILTDCCHSGTNFDLKYSYKNEINIPCSDSWLYTTKPNILKLSGCRDNQTSQSIYMNKTWKGALTMAFLASINKSKSIKEIFKNVNNILSQMGMQQKPVLSANNKGNVGNIFF